MGRQGTIITSPVNQADVQWALGVGSNVNKWSQLCTNGNINKWAKYKPVSYNSRTRLSDSQRRSINYGLKNIPVWSGSGAINRMGLFWFRMSMTSGNAPQCGLYTDFSEYWGYQRPTGGSASPYRITDFINYMYSAVAPVGDCTQSSIKIDCKGEMTIEFDGNGLGQDDGYTVPLSELTGAAVTFGNMYFSVMIHKQNSNSFYVASRDNRWSSDKSTTVTRKVPSAAVGYALEGTCEVFPFLSNDKYTSFEGDLGQAEGPSVAMYIKKEVDVWIEAAKIDITSVEAYRGANPDTGRQTAFFIFELNNTTSLRRRYKLTVTLCDSNGNTLTNISNNPRVISNIAADAGSNTYSMSMDLTGASAIVQRNLYFKAETEMDSIYDPEVIFSGNDQWALTGPIGTRT